MTAEPVVLGALDDYLAHQTIEPISRPMSTDPNWTEKGYLVAYDTTGTILVAVGIGKYVNRNVFDGFAGVVVEGRQYNVRASRELHPDVDATSVGPLEWTVVEPQRRTRVRLADNEIGISFDVTFETNYPAVAEPGGRTRIRGVTVNDTVRYFQLGSASGTVTVGGRRYVLSRSTTFAYKDRSWGVRGMTGVPGSWLVTHTEITDRREGGRFLRDREPKPSLSGMFCVDLGHEAICSTFAESAEGHLQRSSGAAGAGGFAVRSDATAAVGITNLAMDWHFYPRSRRARSFAATITLADGSTRSVEATAIGLTYYFRGGGYFGFRDWWQGKYMGELVVGGEVLDLTDTAVLDELYGCEEIAARFVVDGDVHYGVLEPFAIGILPKYDITAEHRA